jgi:cobalamin biosynthesis Mg chelatase CobN
LDLAKYPTYIGVDVSQTAVKATRERFADNGSIRFLHTNEVTENARAALSLSIDVIYHLVEDEVFDAYMTQLFDASTKFVVIYSSNEDRSWPDPHVRHRQFTRWIDSRRPHFKLMRKIPNAYPYSEDDPDNTSFADFYIFSCAD